MTLVAPAARGAAQRQNLKPGTQSILVDTKPAKKKPKRPRGAFRKFVSSDRLTTFAGKLALNYLRFVRRTSTLTLDPPDPYNALFPDLPAVFAMWHGQHLMTPFVRPEHFDISVMISRHRDGEINAIVAEGFGLGTIRASAARDPSRTVEKGGLKGFLEMKATLAEGRSVAMTADLSNVQSRRVGPGIVMLGKASGRPIIPLAAASSRFVVLKNWDETTVNLPFSKSIGVFGTPVYVPANADEAVLEAKRQEIEAGLNDATARAYAFVGATPGFGKPSETGVARKKA